LIDSQHVDAELAVLWQYVAGAPGVPLIWFIPTAHQKKIRFRQNFTFSSLVMSSVIMNDICNKKLYYREEHSASVVLSWCWCTLWHFSGAMRTRCKNCNSML